jgi:hypothetical protein
MNFLPNNKFAAILVLMGIIVVSVVLATTLIKIKPDPQNVGGFKYSLAGGGKKA